MVESDRRGGDIPDYWIYYTGGRGREFGADEGGQLVSTIRKRTWDWS
jgi:hypothetical protein